MSTKTWQEEFLKEFQEINNGICWENEDGSPQDVITPIIQFITDLRKQDEKLKIKLLEYCQHDKDCILNQVTAGRPTEDGGYEQKICGVWTKENPKCNCGLNDLLI